MVREPNGLHRSRHKSERLADDLTTSTNATFGSADAANELAKQIGSERISLEVCLSWLFWDYSSALSCSSLCSSWQYGAGESEQQGALTTGDERRAIGVQVVVMSSEVSDAKEKRGRSTRAPRGHLQKKGGEKRLFVARCRALLFLASIIAGRKTKDARCGLRFYSSFPTQLCWVSVKRDNYSHRACPTIARWTVTSPITLDKY